MFYFYFYVKQFKLPLCTQSAIQINFSSAFKLLWLSGCCYISTISLLDMISYNLVFIASKQNIEDFLQKEYWAKHWIMVPVWNRSIAHWKFSSVGFFLFFSDSLNGFLHYLDYLSVHTSLSCPPSSPHPSSYFFVPFICRLLSSPPVEAWLLLSSFAKVY